MSRLSIKEPWWWHNKDGGHRMQDPRERDVHHRYLDPDERAFQQHLEQHEEDERVYYPRKDDPPGVLAALAALANTEKTAQIYRELIDSLRKQAKQNRK